jgi:hypothetical protein
MLHVCQQVLLLLALLVLLLAGRRLPAVLPPK